MRCLRVLLALALVFFAARARAEHLPQNPSGEAQFRGHYWRDRNTRVFNPSVDVERVTPSGVRVGAGYLLDAITSASVAAGAALDQPFTELRHEAGARVEVPLGWRDGRPSKSTASVNYSYSSESDYWSHNAGARVRLSLFQDNTSLLIGFDYGHNTVGRRMGPDRYVLATPTMTDCSGLDQKSFAAREKCYGRLHLFHGVVLLTQLLSPTALLTASYELTVGAGYWNNPYRPALVNGDTVRTENLPRLRVRHALAANLRKLFRLDGALVPHLILRPALRVYVDSWGVKAVHPEASLHVPVGPVELRLQYGVYTQWAADFYRSEPGSRTDIVPWAPVYANGPVIVDGEPIFTSDVKLGSYTTQTLELGLTLRLRFLPDIKVFGDAPLSRWLVHLNGGMWFADKAVGNQFGIPFTSGDPSAPAGCLRTCGAFFGTLGLTVPL